MMPIKERDEGAMGALVHKYFVPPSWNTSKDVPRLEQVFFKEGYLDVC